MTPHPAVPSRRTLLRALAAVPASAALLGEAPGLLGSALAAAPPNGSATRYTIEISRLAPQLSTRQQKLALELVRDMADRRDADEA